jgi:hypothetical protein
MASKALYMCIQGAFSTERPCMAMIPLSILSTRNRGCYLQALVDQERGDLGQVERTLIKKNVRQAC